MKTLEYTTAERQLDAAQPPPFTDEEAYHYLMRYALKPHFDRGPRYLEAQETYLAAKRAGRIAGC